MGGQAGREDVFADEVMLVEDVVLHGVSEAEGGDCQIQALDADGWQADDDGGYHSGCDPDGQGGEEVDVVVGYESAGDCRRCSHQSELAQADLSCPTSKHDEGETHDPVDG